MLNRLSGKFILFYPLFYDNAKQQRQQGHVFPVGHTLDAKH